MKKKRKYYDFYVECMENGFMPFGGLCASIPKFSRKDEYTLGLFSPTDDDVANPHNQMSTSLGYWGRSFQFESVFEFNEFRQNVVLFLAAMNNEL